jgi:hypothetical protein
VFAYNCTARLWLLQQSKHVAVDILHNIRFVHGLFVHFIDRKGARGGVQLVEALRYKPEDRGFDYP